MKEAIGVIIVAAAMGLSMIILFASFAAALKVMSEIAT